MNQSEINSMLAASPSPEAAIQHAERVREAKFRGCRCADHPSGHDAECHFSDHRPRSQKEAGK